MARWSAGSRARASISRSATHDHADARWLSPTLETSLLGEAGYRFAVWRGLDITPSVEIGARLAPWLRPEIGASLTIGWLY